jgi:CDP-diacylglycerol--serine O-phosphatidyltransferase
VIVHLPNTITLLNLLSGSLAIVYALEGELGFAGLLILVSGIMDFLDGFAARILKAYSDIGKELDSLADVVSFGVAPALIAFILMKKSLPGLNLPLSEITTSGWNWFLLLSPFMIPVFSALRLAKFNIDERQTVNFIGMPTPANAFLWASLAILYTFTSSPEITVLLFTTRNILITVIVTSLLLVSELPMFSMKFTGLSLTENWFRYLFTGLSALLLIFLKINGLPLIILLYIVMSVIFYLLKVDY